MKISFNILFVLVLFGCGEDRVSFEVPQPDGLRNEKIISQKIIGIYRSLDDSSRLVINSDQIIKIVNTKVAGLLSEMDSVDRIKIKHDTVFSEIDHKTQFDISVKKDSVVYHIHYYDTLFSFLKGDVLRKFKGYYFLNKENHPSQWRVIKLGTTKNGVVIGTISKEEEINNLRELTNSKSDTVYNFKPTRKQLKEFLKERGFQQEERFVKIKESTFRK